MEMPEGWKRLKHYAEDHDAHNDDMGGCFMVCDGYAEALLLMKEMAEMLLTAQKTLEAYDPVTVEEIKAVLKKFQDWK